LRNILFHEGFFVVFLTEEKLKQEKCLKGSLYYMFTLAILLVLLLANRFRKNNISFICFQAW